MIRFVDSTFPIGFRSRHIADLYECIITLDIRLISIRSICSVIEAWFLLFRIPRFFRMEQTNGNKCSIAWPASLKSSGRMSTIQTMFRAADDPSREGSQTFAQVFTPTAQLEARGHFLTGYDGELTIGGDQCSFQLAKTYYRDL